MENIKWVPVFGYKGIYEVSEYGDVRSLERTETQPSKIRSGVYVKSFNRFRKGSILKSNCRWDRLCVELNNNGSKRVSIHRIVYSSFIGYIKDGNVIHHKDGNQNNNHYSNLEQMDYKTHNAIHAHAAWNKGIKNPRSMVENARIAREKNYIPKCKKAYDIKMDGKKTKEISDMIGVCERQVFSMIKRYTEYITKQNICGCCN